MAVVVNAANPIVNLTREQVRDIFTGVIQNWKEVGGSDVPIHLFIRDPISGTYLGFRELAMENKPYADTPNLLTSYETIVEAVAKDTNGIGYSSLELENNAGVKPVSIGGIEPNAADVDKGDYPYARVLHLYTSKGHETPEALDFIQFVQSPQGQAVLTRTRLHASSLSLAHRGPVVAGQITGRTHNVMPARGMGKRGVAIHG